MSSSHAVRCAGWRIRQPAAGGFFYQQFINRFSTTENVAFLLFLRQNRTFFAQKIQNTQPFVCQKVAEWFSAENSCTFADQIL